LHGCILRQTTRASEALNPEIILFEMEENGKLLIRKKSPFLKNTKVQREILVPTSVTAQSKNVKDKSLGLQ